MLINLIEHDTRKSLLSLIEEINRVQTSVWGLAFIKRRALKIMNNDSFVMAVKPAFEDVTEAKVFVLENGDFYVAWRGMQKRAHDQLCAIVSNLLLRDDAGAGSDAAVVYFDPQVMGNEITTLLRAQERESKSEVVYQQGDTPLVLSKTIPKPNGMQMERFREAVSQRFDRKQLQILIVEDQQLLRRLLHEVLRGENAVDSVATLHEGWELYLEKAPDIAFLDIGLGDGSGHDLAKAIKQIDPASCVIMVTANNTVDEIEVARNNHVDGFIAKPYSKQQIFNYIGKHISGRRLASARNKYL